MYSPYMTGEQVDEHEEDAKDDPECFVAEHGFPDEVEED